MGKTLSRTFKVGQIWKARDGKSCQRLVPLYGGSVRLVIELPPTLTQVHKILSSNDNHKGLYTWPALSPPSPQPPLIILPLPSRQVGAINKKTKSPYDSIYLLRDIIYIPAKAISCGSSTLLRWTYRSHRSDGLSDELSVRGMYLDGLATFSQVSGAKGQIKRGKETKGA